MEVTGELTTCFFLVVPAASFVLVDFWNLLFEIQTGLLSNCLVQYQTTRLSRVHCTRLRGSRESFKESFMEFRCILIFNMSRHEKVLDQNMMLLWRGNFRSTRSALKKMMRTVQALGNIEALMWAVTLGITRFFRVSS